MGEQLKFRGQLEAHENWVTSIAATSENPDMIVSSSRDKTIIVWKLQRGEDQYGYPHRSLTGHSHFVSEVVISSDGQFALSGSWDGTLRLWEIQSGRTTRRFVGHAKDVLSVAFSADNRQIVSGSRDKTIKLWNTLGECKYTIQEEGHTEWVSCVRFSPSPSAPVIVSAGWDKLVKVWALSNCKLHTNLIGHTGYLNAVTVSPDGSLCASGGKDGTAMLWDLKEGKRLYSLDAGDIIHSLVFSPNRYWLCAATTAGIKIWDLESKVVVDELRPEFQEVVSPKAIIPYCTCLCWSNNGSILYSGKAPPSATVYTCMWEETSLMADLESKTGERKPSEVLLAARMIEVSIASTAGASPRSPATSARDSTPTAQSAENIAGRVRTLTPSQVSMDLRSSSTNIDVAMVQRQHMQMQMAPDGDCSSEMQRDTAQRSRGTTTAWNHKQAFGDSDLLELIASFQAGERYREFWNGDVAAAEGHFSLMLTKHVTGDPLNFSHLGMHRAAKLGRLDVVQWLHEYTDVQQTPDAMDAAAAAGQVEIVKFLHEKRAQGGCTKFAMNGAAAGGYTDVVEWLHMYRVEGCTEKALDDAAEAGHLEMVKWLHDNRPEGCTHRAMDGAAGNGHLEVIQWLHENRNEGCTGDAIFYAAKRGHLAMVQWLFRYRQERCPFDRNIFDWTAANGHLKVIKFLQEKNVAGCTERAMNWAAENGHLETVKWLSENRVEGCTSEAMDKAAAKGHLDVVRWLHENRSEGCTIRAMHGAALNGYLELVRWLHEHGKRCTDTAMDNAATSGHLDIVMFLHENRKEGCSTKALDNAAARGHLEVVLFLLANRNEGCTERALDWSSRGGCEAIYLNLDRRARIRRDNTRMAGGGGGGGGNSCCTIS